MAFSRENNEVSSHPDAIGEKKPAGRNPREETGGKRVLKTLHHGQSMRVAYSR